MQQTNIRRWDAQGSFPFWLEVLTPVFVGSGDSVSPLESVIREEQGHWYWYGVDLEAWLAEYGQDDSVSRILQSNLLPKIRSLVQERVDPVRFGRWKCRIPSATLAQGLMQKMKNVDGNSTGEVQAAVRNPLTGALYLPGSSLKGALSTPLIDWMDTRAGEKQKLRLRQAGGAQQPQGEYRKWMDQFFGSISEHAMQGLKISDCIGGADSGCVVAARENKCRKTDKEGTPKPPCEAFLPGTLLWGQLHMDTGSGQPALRFPGGERLLFSELVQKVTAFYRVRFEDEFSRFYAMPHLSRTAEALAPLRRRIQAIQPGDKTLLVRIGHYSHIDCVTITANCPVPRQIKGKKLPINTTRTLADNVLPFGWALLHFCSEAEFRAGRDSAEASIRQAVADRNARQYAREQEQNRLDTQARQLRIQQEALRQAREEEASRQMAAEAERKARLAMLSPEEREIACLVEPGIHEEQSMKLFARLETMEPALQRKAAEALRAYWMQIGKWDKKKASQKQAEKIKKVQRLLQLPL